MHYVEVWVADATFHGDEPLTYSCSEPLPAGSLVTVPLRKKHVLGIVSRSTNTKPPFAVKPIMAAASLPSVPAQLVQLFAWMKDYYPAPLGILAGLLLPKQLPKKPLAVTPLPATPAPTLPPLSDDQQRALQAITGEGLHILHGETGTGKTRVYIELAGQQIVAGKSVLILTPEIGLTSQLAKDFRAIFGERVLVIHSQLTDATRERLWQYMIEQAEPLIIIGARSALFSPLKNIGLIVIDEAHETAYKQDQAPYYHATPLAAKLASLHHATLILGSATPLVSDYYVATAKGRPIIRMLQAAKQSDFPERSVVVVDLRDRSNFGKSSYLSKALIQELTATLAKHEQSLIFLNRRGTARVVFCDQCGWQVTCPHCDVPLVYHGDSHLMRCHSCDYKAAVPTSCPSCHNTSVVFKSVGTKAIVAELERLFPGVRIMRFDTDNKRDERMEQHYDELHRGDVDILVGTQTLAKGLDLPRLALVGVVIADTGLFFPDFSAQERTYQLLSQVLGRIGRGHRHGRAIVQTYAPDSPLLQAVLSKDWDGFYEREIAERQTFKFPPFCYALKLTCRRASSASAQNAAAKLAQELTQTHAGITIEGPTPAFHEKVQNKYAWQLIIKSGSRARLTAIIRALPSGWSYDIDPMNLL
jgi:primosomal protein N' (replication factor Y) (superfamily II helicase)